MDFSPDAGGGAAPGHVRAEAPDSGGVHVAWGQRPNPSALLLSEKLILLARSKNHGDGSFDFHGIAVEIRRAIAPLPHRFPCGLHEPRRATYDLQGRDASVAADDRVQ